MVITILSLSVAGQVGKPIRSFELKREGSAKKMHIRYEDAIRIVQGYLPRRAVQRGGGEKIPSFGWTQKEEHSNFAKFDVQHPSSSFLRCGTVPLPFFSPHFPAEPWCCVRGELIDWWPRERS